MKILNGLLTAGLLLGSSHAFSQTVIDENRLAAGYYSRQQWSESIDSFRGLIKRYPESLEASVAQFYLGEAYMQSDDFRNAYLAFQQYLVKHPTSEMSARATFRMGEAAYQLGNDVTAIRLLEVFVAENPNDSLLEFALPYLGEMRLRRVEPQLAARVFEASLKKHPNGQLAPRVVFGLARAYQLMGQQQKAINAFQIIADDELHPRAAEADIRIAHIFLSQNDHDSANQHLLRSLNTSIDPATTTEASYWLARLAILKGDHKTAFELLEPMVGQPATPTIAAAVCFDAAMVAHRLNKSIQANQWLNDFSENLSSSDLADDALHLQIEIAYTSKDDPLRNQTISLVKTFLEKYPQSPWISPVLEKLGRFHYANQNYLDAIAIFEQLLLADQHAEPESAVIDRDNWLYLNALSQIGQKDFVKAESILSRINVATTSDELRVLSQIALATARFGQKKYESAIPAYQNYLSSVEKTSNIDRTQLLRARQELTLCFAETGMWADANRSFQILQTEHAGDPAVNSTASVIASRAVKTGQPQAAMEILERLVVTNSDSETLPVFLSSLGWLKHESGETGQACELFQRLIEEFPEHPLAGSAAMCVAKCYDDKNQHDRAAQHYGWVVRNFGSTGYGKIAKLRRAHSLINTGDKSTYAEAQTLLEEYLAHGGEIEAKDEALFQLGWVAGERGKSDESVAAFLRLLKECPDSKYRPDSSLRLAQSYLVQNKLELATDQLNLIKEDNSWTSSLRVRRLFLLGDVASRQNRWDDVAAAMLLILPEAENLRIKTRASYWLGEASFRQGEFDQAVGHYEFVQDNFEELDAEMYPWIWLRLAQSLGKLEQWRDAKRVAEDGQLRYPKFANGFEFDFVIARGLEDEGLLSDARTVYERVIKSSKGGDTETAAIAQWRVGEIYFHQENYAEAIKSYYLVDSNYGFPQWRSAALLQAGKCQENLANYDHAKKLYSRLIEQFPESEHSRTAQERLKGIQSRATAIPAKHKKSQNRESGTTTKSRN